MKHETDKPKYSVIESYTKADERAVGSCQVCERDLHPRHITEYVCQDAARDANPNQKLALCEDCIEAYVNETGEPFRNTSDTLTWSEWKSLSNWALEATGRLHHAPDNNPFAVGYGSEGLLLKIQELLDGVEWTPETLEQIADLMRNNGYRIRDLDEKEGA